VCSDPPFACSFCVIFFSQFEVDCVTVVTLTTVVVSWVEWDRIALNPSQRLGLHHQWKKWNDTKDCYWWCSV
jgi:hypothetical protein